MSVRYFSIESPPKHTGRMSKNYRQLFPLHSTTRWINHCTWESFNILVSSERLINLQILSEFMSLALIPLLISLGFLLRTAMVLTGLLKGPILETFEKYGDIGNVYYPLPSILLWGGILVLSVTSLIADRASIFLPTMPIGLLLVIASYAAYTNPQIARQYPRIFMSYPRWYFELRERTSRYERRRLAYMWLWLPRRLRLIYNASDHAFNQWADLVILATMRYEDNPDHWRDIPVNANGLF